MLDALQFLIPHWASSSPFILEVHINGSTNILFQLEEL